MIYLPEKSKRDQLIRALDVLTNQAVQQSALQRARWMLSHYWLLGLRDLQPNFLTGHVNASLYNPKDAAGRLKLTYESVVPMWQGEMGRLGKMDIRPAVQALNYGLYSVRKSAAASVILDYLLSATDWRSLQRDVNYSAVTFGPIAIGAWIKTQKMQGAGLGSPISDESVTPVAKEEPESSVVLEVIPPWEILPLPPEPETAYMVEGLCRRRWVPLSWLKTKPGLKLPTTAEGKAKLKIREGAFGISPTNEEVNVITRMHSADPSPTALFGANHPEAGGGTPKDTYEEYVLLEEFFPFAERRDRLSRWVVKIGDWIAADVEYAETDNVYVPIGVDRYLPIGGFYGRGYVELLTSMNSVVERVAQQFFGNIEDLDNFGTTLIPTTWGVSISSLLKGRGTRKIAAYEPDYTAPDIKLQSIQPIIPTDVPGRAIVQGENMMKTLGQHSDLLKGDAPGRVDSASALELLYDTANIPLSVPAAGIAGALRQVYKAVLAAAPDLLAGRADLPLLRLDENLIGLAIDPTGSNVTLDASQFPMPHEVNIGIKDEMPRSPSLRKKELLEALGVGLITPQEFKVYCWKEDLDYPTGSWAAKESYRKAMLQCIYLFGDGTTPGSNVPTSSEADQFEVHLDIIQMFMSKPEFTFASVDVKNAFVELKREYLRLMGTQYPADMPYPEDTAEMAQATQPAAPPTM